MNRPLDSRAADTQARAQMREQHHILCLSIPNPFFEGRNQIYVLKSDPVTVIDTGIATNKAFDALVHGLAENGLAVTDVQRVILTHKHIDHIGNAWRIQQESGADILIHEEELHAVQDVDPDGHKFKELVQERFEDWHVPQEAFPRQASGWRWEIEPSEPTGVRDGQRLPQDGGDLEVIHTPGHTMGSICLKHPACLFSGDHVLPDISPNVGGGDMRHQDMLRHFLASLRRIVDLTDGGIPVLPGHGKLFHHLHRRCRELVEHHDERLDEVIEVLQRDGSSQTVYQIAHQLFGNMRDFHVILGCAEAAAHLEYLEREDRVTSRGGNYQLV